MSILISGIQYFVKFGSRMRFVFVSLVFFLIVTGWGENESAPVQKWAAAYKVNNLTSGTRIKQDNSGNVYVTGGTGRTSSIDEDIFLIKYDSCGNEQWSKTYNGDGKNDDNAADMLIDNADNIYITGRSVNSDNEYETVLLKYNPYGSREWLAKYIVKGAFCEPVAMTFDCRGDICVTGFRKGYQGSDDNSIFTVKFSTEGILLWSADSAFGYIDYEEPVAIKTDKDCNIFIAGNIGKPKLGSADFLVAKYDPAGKLEWSRIYDGPAKGNDIPTAMDIDDLGNCVVSGYSRNDSNIYVYLTLKYDTRGDLLWSKQFGAAIGAAYASCLKIDAAGNIIVAGNTWAGSAYYDDISTVKYDPQGNLLWSAVYSLKGSYEEAAAIETDDSENVYVACNSSIGKFFLLGYDPGGQQKWVTAYEGNGKAGGLFINNRISLFVTGSTSDNSGKKILTVKFAFGNEDCK